MDPGTKLNKYWQYSGQIFTKFVIVIELVKIDYT